MIIAKSYLFYTVSRNISVCINMVWTRSHTVRLRLKNDTNILQSRRRFPKNKLAYPNHFRAAFGETAQPSNSTEFGSAYKYHCFIFCWKLLSGCYTAFGRVSGQGGRKKLCAVDPQRVFRGEYNVVLWHLAPLFDLSEEFGVTECTATVWFWLLREKGVALILLGMCNSEIVADLLKSWGLTNTILILRGDRSARKNKKNSSLFRLQIITITL